MRHEGRWRRLWPLLAIAVLPLGASPAPGQPYSEWLASQWHLWRINIDGSGLEPLDQTPGGRCGSPVWAPNGKHIAYDYSNGTSGPEIVTIRSDGTERRMIGTGGVADWSPDGKLIACSSRGTVVMNRDGSGRETIMEGGWCPRWMPHSNRIVSLVHQRGDSIWLFDLATGKRDTISFGPVSIFHGFDISPDGKRVCFGTTGSGIGIATLDERTMQATVRWLVDSGIAYHASWSPDGHHVAYAWQPTENDVIQIYLLDVDGNDEPKLLPGLDLTRDNVNPAWSPDGKTIVFSSSEPL